jgi:hypothetical protein
MQLWRVIGLFILLQKSLLALYNLHDYCCALIDVTGSDHENVGGTAHGPEVGRFRDWGLIHYLVSKRSRDTAKSQSREARR